MPRLNIFLDSQCRFEADSTELLLSPEESHHLCKVLRAREGMPVMALDGKGSRYHASLMVPDARKARLKIAEIEKEERPTPEIVLVQAIPKGKTMEAILKNSVEIGLSRIIPVSSDHVEGQPSGREEKWTRIMREAVKQSGNTWLPDLKPISPLQEAVSSILQSGISGCLASLEKDAEPLFPFLTRLAPNKPKRYFYCIGPEGDFSTEEYVFFRERRVSPVALGNTILRSDTASLVCGAMITAALRSSPPRKHTLTY